MPGPPPKRSTQRRRRNAGPPVAKGATTGETYGPALTGTHSAVGRRFHEALRRSGQAQWFQPSDWAAAELVVIAIDTFVKKPTAMMLASIQSACVSLLVTEGDRRRLHVELEQAPEAGSEQDASISRLTDFRRTVTGQPA